MKKSIFIIFLLVLTLSAFNFVRAEEKIEIDFFFGAICPFCAQEKIFLRELIDKYPEIELREYNASENIDLLMEKYQSYAVPENLWGFVPISFVGERYFLSFDEQVADDIEDYVLELIEGISQPPPEPPSDEHKISLPIFGEISLSRLSPLTLSIVLGALDGFNACAMVALGFLLTVLISTGIRERVFLIGGTFILVSGIVYFLFISAWLNLFLVLSHLKFITNLVGGIIAIFAIFLLKDYFHGVVCKLCEIKPGKENIFVRFEKKLFKRMETISKMETSLPVTIFGTVIVAAGVNMVELCCSFGFPLVFTRILTSFNLPTSSYYFYLLIYILFYMIDDFIIFIIAVLTLRITQASQKYLKAIKLISGILLLFLGLIIMFCPEILMLF
jgi:thiol-disulfide isomerase/thioredoxin